VGIDRFHQKAKCGTTNDEFYDVFVPHSSFQGDEV